MRVHYVQHVPFEGLGSIEVWLQKEGCEISVSKLYESTYLPDGSDFDMLIIMGGPMSVNDEEQYPWLRIEKQLIKTAIEENKAVLGICLGAQLIVNCLGESVHPNRRKEIGWFPVQGIDHESSAYRFPQTLDVFHWHGETFDLPQNAIHLARSEACENQAFQIGSSVIGLQFHLETTEETAQAIITNCRQELLPSVYVQPEEVILDHSPEKYKSINKEMAKVLRYLQKQVRAQNRSK